MSYSLHIEQNETKLEITLRSRVNPILRIVLAMFLLTALVAAFISVGKIIAGSGNLFIFIVAILLPISSLLLARLFLWNVYGKEIISIEGNRLTQSFDYKWYRDKNEYSGVSFTVEFEPSERSSDPLGRIKINGSAEPVESVILIRSSDFDRLLSGVNPKNVNVIARQLKLQAD